MKRTFLKVGATVGAASLAVLTAGPAMAATPVSQASAQGIDLGLAGHTLVTGKTVATNDGKTQTKSTVNTLPGVAGLVPGTNIAGLGVVLQDAYAKTTGYSTACAGLTGQGGGLVQVGDRECSINGGQATTVSLANLDLGTLVADPNTIVGQVTTALGINGLGGNLNALVAPITKALSDNLGNVGLTGSIGVVAAQCQATPTSANGNAEITDSHIGITLGGQTVNLVDLPSSVGPNTHVLVNLDKVTASLLNAVTTEVTNLLNNPTGTAGGSILGQVGAGLSQLGAVTSILGTTLKQITDAVQAQVITQLTSALQPLLTALQQNVLDITLNKQPVPQANKTFDATALDLQVLPALKQFTGGSSLVGGFIGHVTCGPNTLAKVVTPTPSPSKTPSNNVPKNIDSGLGGGSNTGTIIAAMSVLLAAGGAAGATAYRRYWMPRG